MEYEDKLKILAKEEEYSLISWNRTINDKEEFYCCFKLSNEVLENFAKQVLQIPEDENSASHS